MTVTSPLEDELSTSTSAWNLIACSSWLAGQQFPIKSKQGNNIVRIGRGSHCDIIFPGTHLSREHVELRIEDNHLYVKDKGSVNGTFINEVRISEGVIRPGDKLRLDVYSFTIDGPQELNVSLNSDPEPDLDATKFRATAAAAPAPQIPSSQQQRATRASATTNSFEPPQAEETANLMPLYLVAGALLVAVAGLGAYLFFT